MQELKGCACTGKSLPRLLRPAILSVLAKNSSHGYAMIEELKRLAVVGDHPPDHTGVYRMLQVMEKEGLVASDWECGASGPARHNYRLTPKGRACLERWKRTLDEYRRTIDMLLKSL
jgi:DNA-binding PadR family transcriptional regulator